jgi:hypothetical protein
VNYRRLARIAVPAGLLLAVGAAAPALSESLRLHPRTLLAATPSGGMPNAAASDPTISGDGRIDRYAAFSSAVTDIVAGAGTGQFRNVFVVHRKTPFSTEGTLWHVDDTTLASRGLGGQPANGDSWGPSFDGYDYVHAGHEYTIAPSCLAFVSNASNLVAGDTDGRADVFVQHLSNGKLTRISAPAPVTEVELDGRCFAVSYVAGGTVYTKQIRFGSGKVRRVSAIDGASSPALSANGKIVTYDRNGVVYVNRDGHTRKIAAGTDPSSDEWGRFVAFNRGPQLWQANTTGAADAHRVATKIHRQDHQKLMNGTSPSMTSGGSFVFFADGNMVDSNVYEKFASCPSGDPTQVQGSPHGNYAVYACSSGAVYMSYVGHK